MSLTEIIRTAKCVLKTYVRSGEFNDLKNNVIFGTYLLISGVSGFYAASTAEQHSDLAREVAYETRKYGLSSHTQDDDVLHLAVKGTAQTAVAIGFGIAAARRRHK